MDLLSFREFFMSPRERPVSLFSRWEHVRSGKSKFEMRAPASELVKISGAKCLLRVLALCRNAGCRHMTLTLQVAPKAQ